ncbi:MAG: hypothetical protein HKO68_02715 [Desulfobacterales bacterium]|nr:hypothetical protein [Desulfobacterales bacterium]
MVWMQYLGIGLLLATLAMGAYLVLRTELDAKRLVIFTSLGFFVGIFLFLANHITSIEIPAVDEIIATAGQVRADAAAVKEHRQEIERHKDEIASAARNTDKAHQDLAALSEIKKKADSQLDSIQQAASEAEKGLKRLNSITDFSMLLARANNDNRYAFDLLVEIAKTDGIFKELAESAVIEIAHEIKLRDRIDPKFPWDAYSISPEKSLLGEWRAIYNHIPALYRPAFLSRFWQQERFSMHDRLEFLYIIIRSDSSLRTVHRACMLMNNVAKLNKNILAKELYIEWWEKEKTIKNW